MRFVGQIKGIAIKPTKDASQIEVRIVAASRRGLAEALSRLLMADVSVEISESQLQLPETEAQA